MIGISASPLFANLDLLRNAQSRAAEVDARDRSYQRENAKRSRRKKTRPERREVTESPESQRR